MHDPRSPPTIDVTLEGDVVAPPSFWSKARALWRVLPRGAVPALLVFIILFAALAIVLVGVLIIAVPIIIAVALLALLFRAGSGPAGSGPPRRL